MSSLKDGAIKTWKVVAAIFSVLISVVLYLVSKNKKLLTKVIQSDAKAKDAVLENEKKHLANEQDRLEQESEDLKRMAESAKKDMSPEDVEKYWKDEE